jgi:sterol desaturase/sphingolipid hydroxylase (fatty acid hydroxylase superfamily)
MEQVQPTRIFRNPVLEFFTYTSFKVTLVTYSLLVSTLVFLNAFIGGAGWPAALALFAGGTLFWTFLEYVLHRYVFHWSSELALIRRFTHIMHGIHHQAPHHEGRVFMPPLPGMIISCLLFGIYYFAGGNYAYMFLAGTLFGYLIYSIIHYLIHVKRVPWYLKKLHVHHALHHYRYPDKAFGVSTLFWDRVFGTMTPEELSQGPGVSSQKPGIRSDV